MTSLDASRTPEPPSAGVAWFAGVRAQGVVECVDVRASPERLAAPGFWAVVGEFDGSVRAWRFAEVSRGAHEGPAEGWLAGGAWHGPPPEAWSSSMSRAQYLDAVTRTREEIRRGRVYQANICRVLSAPLEQVGGGEPDAPALSALLAAGNPAPYAGGVHVPAGGGVEPVWVVTASPELFLRVDGDVITSAPIKGTAQHPDALQAKDRAENVMITDLVRNDLQRVCEPGTVEVVDLLALEQHPGLVHLVSTVRGRLRAEVAGSPRMWADVLDAAYPPASVSGAPKSSALQVIAELERAARGPYCGTVGWIDVAEDGRVRAELAVAIRSFWWTPDTRAGGVLRFGTGAGITWGSDAEGEWAETELKARRLVALASAER